VRADAIARWWGFGEEIEATRRGDQAMARLRLVRTFTAYDPDGHAHTLHEYAEILDAGTHDDPKAEKEGLHELRTADGQSVNVLGTGRYQIVQSGVILTDRPK
jgi:hypothetical protein